MSDWLTIAALAGAVAWDFVRARPALRARVVARLTFRDWGA
ncbi:hypothetical protein ACFOWE_31295 [Planomonospora corallina]|uniref:Uncharacterized protein n=1 Tax=Planomonospora corallina TaxID=1806052 RepID=A0ABV8III3_9ACTN